MKNSSRNILTALFGLCLLLSSMPSAFAMTINQAKSAGFIGEQYNGYLGIVKQGAPQDTLTAMQQINAKRKTHYRSIARTNNISLKDVESAAGKKLIARTPKGQYVKYYNRRWMQKS